MVAQLVKLIVFPTHAVGALSRITRMKNPRYVSRRSLKAFHSGTLQIWLVWVLGTIASAPILAAQSTSLNPTLAPPKFPQFANARNDSEYRFNFSNWNAALDGMVVDFGISDRVGVARPSAKTGTRFVRGHTSKYRLEGNRIPFSYLSKDAKAVLTILREDLESIGNQIPLEEFSRNSQMAFWMNLHNAIVIEQIALHYPVVQPERIVIGPEKIPLNDAKLTSIQGAALSLRDIREEIVYRNWQEPNAIYGFFRGTVGGPSIQTRAFTDTNLDQLLKDSAQEFVNSLRGVSKSNKNITLSKIYEEAMPLFATWPQDLVDHLMTHSNSVVAAYFHLSLPISTNIYEPTVADLVAGRPIESFDAPRDALAQAGARSRRLGGGNFYTPSSTAGRLLGELQEKQQRLRLRELRKRPFLERFRRPRGNVIVEEIERVEPN